MCILRTKLYYKLSYNYNYYNLSKKFSYFIFLFIVTLFLSILYNFYVNEYFFSNNIDNELVFDKVIIEDAKGYLDIYTNHEGKKKKLRSYPVEFMVIYDYQFYDHNKLLLEQIIKNKLKNIELSLEPQTRQMWSPTKIGGIDSGWLKGEICSGYYNKKIFVKFSYFLQDAYGYELDAIYKCWPALKRVMGKSVQIRKNDFYYENFELGFSLKQDTLKIRKGHITRVSNNLNLLTNYYNDCRKHAINCFFYRSDSKSPNYQVLVLDNYTETFYNDIFKKKKKNLKYFKKIYMNLNIEKELTYFEKHYHYLSKFYK